jgi:hypothetical protein
MPDPIPTPTPTPAPTPKAKRDHSPINQEWIKELNDSEQIAAAAQKPAYAPTLAEGDIDAAKVTAFAKAVSDAQKLAGTATQKTTSKVGVTNREAELMGNLVELIQEVQKRAKQKYEAKNPTVLKDYAVGGKWYNTRTILEQTATNILGKLAADTLPGIDAAKVAALQKALNDYKQVQTDQIGGQADATTDRANLEVAVKDIVARRREIQFAADAAWPHTNKANAGIRTEFKLPTDRALT